VHGRNRLAYQERVGCPALALPLPRALPTCALVGCRGTWLALVVLQLMMVPSGTSRLVCVAASLHAHACVQPPGMYAQHAAGTDAQHVSQTGADILKGLVVSKCSTGSRRAKADEGSEGRLL